MRVRAYCSQMIIDNFGSLSHEDIVPEEPYQWILEKRSPLDSTVLSEDLNQELPFL